MSDVEPNSPNPAPAPDPSPQPAPVALVNHEGALRENWRETLPEGIRDKKVFDRVKDFPGAMTSLAHFESMVGADTMVRPSESSGDDAWNEYFKVGGRPDTAAEYGFERPKDFPEEHYSQERAVKAAEMLHAAGASSKLAKAIFEWHHADISAQLKDQATNAGLAFDELKTNLISDWGNSYEAKTHIGNAALEKGFELSKSTDPEFKERIIEKVNKDPDLLRFFGDFGALVQESQGIDLPTNANETPADLDEQLGELMATDAFNNKIHPQHKAAMAKQEALIKKGAKTNRVA